MSNVVLETNANSTTGASVRTGALNKTIQAFMDATVSAAAVVEVLGSNDGTHFHVLGTITLSGANDVDGLVNNDAWKFIQCRTTATAVVGTVTVLLNTERT